MNFEAFKCDIINNKWSVYGVEVYIDGRSIYRYGDIEEGRYPIYSATRSITAIAVGMAVDEGKLDVDRPILAYLPIDVIAEMQRSRRQSTANLA